MHTDLHAPTRRFPPWALILGAGLVLSAATSIRLAVVELRAGAPSGDLPADVLALGEVIRPAARDGNVTAAEAIAAATAVFGEVPDATVDTYLVEITDPRILGGMTGRPIWIVRYTGIEWPMPIPDIPGELAPVGADPTADTLPRFESPFAIRPRVAR
jgi:hypothetical protein